MDTRIWTKNWVKKTYLNRPILRKCENISPPGTYSSTMYKYVLSLIYNIKKARKKQYFLSK